MKADLREKFKKDRVWCQLSESALKNNITNIFHHLPNHLRKMAVVKANAYGHNALWVSQIALTCGFTDLAVATIEEGIELREAGIDAPILILSPYISNHLDSLLEFDLAQTISSQQEINLVNQDYKHSLSHKKLKVHIKLDTGMNRIGFLAYGPKQDEELNTVIQFLKQDQVEALGIFTHFATADEPDNDFTHIQFERFSQALAILKKADVYFEFTHCANSAASIEFDQTQLDGVRIGIIMYGWSPARVIKDKLKLEPVMSFFSRISSLHEANANETVGYNCTYTCSRKTKIATIEVGYADGIQRQLSNKGYVLIKGKKANIIGNICMDRTMLDVTDIPNIEIGDEVLIFGKDQANHFIDLDELASLAGTISYEILCGISYRVPRIYTN